MRTLEALKSRLESVKKLSTAKKIANKFKEEAEIDFNYEFRGVNVYAGHDSIAIFESGIEKFVITYNRPVFFN